MIKTGANNGTLKEIKARDLKEKETALLEKCEALAAQRMGSQDELLKLSNKYKGIWYLPIVDDDGEIEKMALMKPIDRNILSYASTKITDEGLYAFLESCMRECLIKVDGKDELNDMDILEDDQYFIPAANSFNKILEGKKASLLKR